ncbi:death domain-associated protein 6 isoform X2 [Spea bombifrons]|uniref:death domain-associated protein 6 isoform X2 n=1 Tax=Spea bombifrons TaxID=233779 RepID=UPI0023498768|nr:death domain-associated protein 6 isoform X2 [Spea bombifrons]
MAHVDEVIVLDDENDEEQVKPHSPPSPPPSQSNGKDVAESEKKSQILKVQNNQLFEEFVDYCSGLTAEHPEVISFLKGKYSRANPSFLSSTEFCNVLGRCLTRVQNKRSKVFVYINELCTALKAHTQKRKVSLQPSSSLQPWKEDCEKKKEVEEKEEEEDGGDNGAKTGSKRQIRYLENLLRLYSREIQKLQEKELTLEELEDEDSAYIQESRLKRKILRIFQKLCELKDCSSLTGRVIEQKIPYHGTRYPEVNRRLEKFINGSHDVFPDYGDVLRVIQKASEKHGLGISRKKMQGMAQDAFRELGNRLQERRHLDLVYNFGCHLTDSYKPGNDPANQDSSLQRRLRENRSVALTRLDDIIKKYAVMQDEGEEDESNRSKKENESPSSSRAEESSSRHAESPPSRESAEEEETEEEDDEESETDIEDDLKRSQEVSGEEGDEEEEEQPADPDNEDDQRMDIPDSQPPSSNDNRLNEEGEEPPGECSTPTSSAPAVQEEAPVTKANLEAECPSDPSIEEATSTSRRGEEQEELYKADASSADTSQSDKKIILQMENHSPGGLTLKGVTSVKIKVQKDNPVNVNECGAPAGMESDKTSDTNVLPMKKVKSCSASAELCRSKSKMDNAADPGTDFSPVRSGNKRTSLLKHKSLGVTEKGSSPSTNIMSRQTENESTSDVDTDDFVIGKPSVKRRLKADRPQNVDNGVGNVMKNTEVPHTGNSNGIVHVITERRKSTSRSTKDNAADGHSGSAKCGRTKEPSPPPRKRKKSPSLENGKRTMNGGGEMESRCKKARSDCSNTSLPASPDPDDEREDPDITLDLEVTCIPLSTPTKQILKCDPDEVIVLSD